MCVTDWISRVLNTKETKKEQKRLFNSGTLLPQQNELIIQIKKERMKERKTDRQTEGEKGRRRDIKSTGVLSLMTGLTLG